MKALKLAGRAVAGIIIRAAGRLGTGEQARLQGWTRRFWTRRLLEDMEDILNGYMDVGKSRIRSWTGQKSFRTMFTATAKKGVNW